MKKNGKLIIAAVAVLVLAAVFAGVWAATRPAASQGAKTITVEVVHKDESSKTDGAYWAFYQGGEYASQSVDQTPINDGDAFSLVYTVG